MYVSNYVSLIYVLFIRLSYNRMGIFYNIWDRMLIDICVFISDRLSILLLIGYIYVPILIHELAINFYNYGMLSKYLIFLNLILESDISNIFKLLLDNPYANILT